MIALAKGLEPQTAIEAESCTKSGRSYYMNEFKHLVGRIPRIKYSDYEFPDSIFLELNVDRVLDKEVKLSRTILGGCAYY